MSDKTAALAHSITWTSSKQTYFTGRLLVDKNLISDFYRAYAYFRWSDDMIDDSSLSHSERISFIRRQRELIDLLYENDRPDSLTEEEEILADLIYHDLGENSGLQSFIRNMFEIIEFDAYRKGRLIGASELKWYTNTLAKSVTDGLHYFVGNGHPYPALDKRYSAAFAAHITHLLRDKLSDTEQGFINIPREYLKSHNISPADIQSPPYRDWVRGRLELARELFHDGKCYLNELDILRTKIVGYWYCARFESVLDTIESDGYILRTGYDERSKTSTWLKIAGVGISVTLRHFGKRISLEFARILENRN